MAFFTSTLMLLLVSYILLCRVNDLRVRQRVWHEHLRLVALAVGAVMPLAIIGTQVVYRDWPSPYEALFAVALACIFATTPNQPPLWKFLVKGVE